MKLAYTVTALVLFAAPVGAADNELTEKERADGWVLLFDGKSLDGWTTSAVGRSTMRPSGVKSLIGSNGSFAPSDGLMTKKAPVIAVV